MAAVRIRIFKIDGIEYAGIIDASKILGISLSTVLRKYKKNEKFECNGKLVESYLIKPERKKSDERKEKLCTKCKNIFPNNTDFFHLDTQKVKLKHATVLSSMCKKCKAKYQSDNLKKKRIQAKEIGTTLYAQLPQEKKQYHIKRNAEYIKENREKINAKARERVKRKTPGILNTYKKGREKSKYNSQIMNDYYICRLIHRNNKELTIKELLRYPDLLDLHRSNLKLKRACKALETSTN